MTAATKTVSIFRAFAAVAVVLLVACNGSDESWAIPSLGIEEIEAAVAAVREQQGSEPQFFEINSTADGVNLFVAVSRSAESGAPDAVVQGRYTPEGGLVLSAEMLDASGPVFTVDDKNLDDLNLDPDLLLGVVVKELENSTPLMFVLTATNSGDESANISGPVMRVIMESPRGGRLAVFVATDGTILGTEVLEG